MTTTVPVDLNAVTVVGLQSPIAPKPDLEALRAAAVDAFHHGVADVYEAACKALMDANDPDPPKEARGLLVKWGYLK